MLKNIPLIIKSAIFQLFAVTCYFKIFLEKNVIKTLYCGRFFCNLRQIFAVGSHLFLHFVKNKGVNDGYFE